MDRNREARRASMATSNGLSRRRHRSSSLRDSPEEDGAVELPETARLRDRGSKKDRDRERDRDRDRSSRSKRRRGDRLMHGSNREDGGEESTEESVNDEEEEDEDDAGAVRMLPPNPTSLSSSMSNHQHRKSYPPAKVVRAPPVWKAADEMIGVSVPRKARSASTKRSHECWTSGVAGVPGEQIHRQASTSPVRPNLAASTAAVAASPASISPSSSNVSIRKKMPNGPKPRPPKSSSKASSSIQEDIEIEVAEALAVMRQSQGPSKQEIMANDSLKFDSREVNKSTNEAKSRVSSPISNSPSSAQQSSSMLPQNSNSSAPPLSAVAPKRKRPRPRHEDENPAIFGVRNSPISSTAKVEIDQPAKIESTSPNLEKNPGSANENGGVSYDLMNSQSVPASSEPQPESLKLGDSKPLTEEAESRDVGVTKEEPSSPEKESPLPKLDDDRQDATGTKANSTISDVEKQREEKFQIDLMAPPPQMRSSPERDGEINFVAADPKPMVSDMDTEMKPMVKEGEKVVKIGKDEAMNAEPQEKKAKSIVDEAEPHKSIVNKERIIDLQLDLEKHDRDTGNGSVGSSKLNQHAPKQLQQPRALKEEQNTEKTAQSSGSLPLPMSVASWPGGLPPMGYMAPLQGVVSMDGSTVSSAAIQPPHFLFSQPRLKRCATHCYIAWNICQHQQFTRMNPFWPAAAGTPSLYGAKPCNLNVLPSVDLHGNFPGRNANPLQDKGQGLAIFSGHSGKDKGSQAANPVDAAQRKQILLQQALPPGAPSSILHGPFIFPLGQQQAVVAAASARPGSVKSPPPTSSAASSSASNSAPVSASTTAAATTPFPGTATAMSFNYPNLPASDTQYLAILPNNGYPFPIPAHVGAPPAYRGTHAQAVPFFNGPFYSSQMLHPSQLPQQQQQQQQQQPTQQPQQIQHGHQNTSISSGSSSSQKHLQNHPQQQQQRPHGSGVNGGSGSLQSFPAPKNRPAQPPVMQQPQQLQHAHVQLPHQARQLEAEVGSEDSPSTADSRVSRGSQNVYGQNFAMSLHPSNFALVAPPASLGSASGTSANHGEKKQQQPQQHGLKAGVESLPSQAFAMSFASINGAAAAPGLDISSMAQNHAILQSLPEAAARHGYHIIATAQAAQQKKNYRATEEGKSGIGDSSSVEEERKALAGKAAATVGQSIAFSRPDLPDTSVSTIPGNGVIDSSTRTLNLSSAPARASASVSPATASATNGPNSQQRQQQQQQQQQQQMIQLQKQHQFATVSAAAARSKTPATSNGSVYSDHLPSSSSMAAKFPNALSAFPPNFVQGSSSPGQSPQWKNSVRTSTSQVPTLALSSTASSLKNISQQQGRSQQSHIQISFAANPKSSAAPQGQQAPNSNQSPSPPMVVGSPTSLSKSTGGSPRTTPASTGNKTGQASSLSSQQAKNSPSVPSRKSSPVGGRNVTSILGNPHITSSNNGPKPPMQQQQQQQQQLSKQSLQQTQLFFSSPYLQTQGPHSTTSTSSASSGYYLQRRRSEQQPQQQQPQGSSGTSSTGMLTLCPPVTLASASTSDPARAIAAAGSNMKGGGLPSQGIIHAAQFAAAQSSGNPHSLFPYVHAVPTAVQVKPAEQKQPAGE
ncbi:hypothetical protein PVL29_005893 [Vitis rotundifolia]|uniref:Time for coffee n=1 Tax=Vitis rotundifolia TaxID=103349 RepID=A0AA39DYP5_VITRO|nr:hypothetical protein PVL29_005893 [Vitis rotundifolia]